MRTLTMGFLGIALSVALVPFDVSAYTFSRNLTFGDTGADVLELQKILNTDSRTQLAGSGTGSPGYETEYFGTLTADAVRRYQNLYAEKILTPLGLSSGTGFFGQSTRTYISGIPTPESTTDNVPQKESTVGTTPHISYLSPDSGPIGTVVTIYGYGFLDSGNQVGSAFEEWGEVDSSDGTTLTITIKSPYPDSFLKKNGDFFADNGVELEYQIGVHNNAGGSNFVPFTLTF